MCVPTKSRDVGIHVFYLGVCVRVPNPHPINLCDHVWRNDGGFAGVPFPGRGRGHMVFGLCLCLARKSFLRVHELLAKPPIAPIVKWYDISFPSLCLYGGGTAGVPGSIPGGRIHGGVAAVVRASLLVRVGLQ